jgi:broad specificity phosphatase PhoE
VKQIYVLRHANWDLDKDSLTEEGKRACLALRKKLGKFDIIICSNFARNKETAKLLSGALPEVDVRAGILNLTEEQNKKISELRKKHPLGVAGAIFSCPELIVPVRKAGEKLIMLVKELLAALPENGKTLIVSHDGTMVSAEKILKNESFSNIERTYSELEGFVIDEFLNVEYFYP